MKKCLITSVLVIISFNLFCQQNLWMKYFHRGDEAGFSKINDSIYVSTFETRNFDYQNFLNFLQTAGRIEDYYNCVPDSTQWSKKSNYSFIKDFSINYRIDPKYKDYPVVNITKDAMEMYCNWLTNVYEQEGTRFRKIIVRLPNENEWVNFSDPQKNYYLPWNSKSPYYAPKKRHCTDSCFRAAVKANDSKSGENVFGFSGTGISYVGAQETNDNGLYDVIGNAAEMTEDGMIKGGSWDNYIQECYLFLSQDYVVPDPRVGFRIVIEIIQF